MIDLNHKNIIISRTDSIGDVMLTLPICHWIKETFPTCKLIFLGKTYTKPIIECFECVDQFIDYIEISSLPNPQKITFFKSLKGDVIIHVFPNKEIGKIAKHAKIPIRIGTSHRFHHWSTCNFRIGFSRKKSNYHEAQLNFELLRPFGLKSIPTLNQVTEMMSGFVVNKKFTLPDTSFIQEGKTIVLHPKSQGSAVEWPMTNYAKLAIQLANAGFQVLFTGTEKEGQLFRKQIPTHERIRDVSGKYALEEFTVLLSKVDGIVACSTGPLHISAALGKKAIGLYVNKRPIHPGRWGALGKNSIKIIPPNTDNQQEKDIESINVQSILTELGVD